MNVQNPSGLSRGRLRLSWVEVRDQAGRTHVEARWTVVRPPVTGSSIQAA